jgi:hemoglobin
LDQPTPPTPYELVGGEPVVRRITERFYDAMEQREPALTATHRLTPDGRIHPDVRAHFGLFLLGWLGGPQTYTATRGHPRLRMRHAHVPIDSAMRDAWLRCMTAALDAEGISDPVRAFLDQRFAEVADFLRNTPDG